MAWALASPLMTAPDEAAHTYRAVSLYRGDLFPPQTDGGSRMSVPAGIEALDLRVSCTKYHSDTAARCPDVPTPAAGDATVVSGAGTYLPLYYYAVGWPSRLLSGDRAVFAMRLLSGLVTAGFLAAAVRVLRRQPPLVATAAAGSMVTPLVLYIGAAVNPSAWELAASLLFWTAGIAIVSGSRGQPSRYLLGLLGMSGTTELLTRRLSPLWLVLVLVSLWVSDPQGRIRRDLHHRAPRIVAATLLLAGGVSVSWHYLVDAPSALSASGGTPMSLPSRILLTLADEKNWFREFYGVLGYLDTRTPPPAYALWGGIFVALVAASVRHVSRRHLVALLILGFGSFVVPVILQVATGPQTGDHVWQGRYTFPLAMGIPLLCANKIATEPWARRIPARALPLVFGASLLGVVWSFAVVEHRYTSGVHEAWSLDAVAWAPPLGLLTPAACLLAGIAVSCWSIDLS